MAYVFERFTDRARRVLVFAQEEAGNLGHNFIGTEHILLGLVEMNKGVAGKALRSLGVELEALRTEITRLVAPNAVEARGKRTHRAKKVLEQHLVARPAAEASTEAEAPEDAEPRG